MVRMFMLNVDPKMLRETLCIAQSAIIAQDMTYEQKRSHLDRIQTIISECDRHRPVSIDGKHGENHTKTCGCDEQ
jgi:hypothetical protein